MACLRGMKMVHGIEYHKNVRTISLLYHKLAGTSSVRLRIPLADDIACGRNETHNSIFVHTPRRSGLQ